MFLTGIQQDISLEFCVICCRDHFLWEMLCTHMVSRLQNYLLSESPVATYLMLWFMRSLENRHTLHTSPIHTPTCNLRQNTFCSFRSADSVNAANWFSALYAASRYTLSKSQNTNKQNNYTHKAHEHSTTRI